VSAFDGVAPNPTRPAFYSQQVRKGNSILTLLLVAGLLIITGVLLSNLGILQTGIFRSNPPIHSVAVLPLKNLSDDPSQKYFAEGMTEELITDLSQLRALKVISRTSSGLYEDSHKALPEIGRELNAEAIVVGSVQRFGDRVRVIAQLTYAPRDQNIWARTYERDVKDALALQSEVAAAIAGEIRTQISPTEDARLHASRPINVRALEAYLQGTYYINQKGHGVGDLANDTAAKYFRQAIADDASFAPSYVALANTYEALLRPSVQAHLAMKAAVEKALALDPNSSDAHAAFALVMSDDWQWATAESEYRQAIALNPNKVEAHLALASFLQAMGRSPEAVPEFERAQELDPREEHLSSILADQGNYDQAIALKRHAVENDPDNGYLHYELSSLLADAGYYEDWAQEMQRTLVLFGFPELASPLDRAFKRAGFRGAMQVWADDLERAQAQGIVYMPITLADVYVCLGKRDRAFFWLEDAFQHYRQGYSESADGGMKWLKGDGGLKPLHGDPRYVDLIRRMGLP
jgi:TolB-like protein